MFSNLRNHSASALLILLWGAATAQAQSTGAALQALIDAAPDHGVVNADPNAPLVLSTPLTIRKPLTLTGLNAELPAGLGKTPLLVIEADGVAVTDIELRGNADSVDQADRNALLEVRASDFRIERARFLNSAKDGIMIDGGGVPDRDIVGGVIRDIYGTGNVRDLVSIGGGGEHGRRIRHVLVDNVRAFDSSKRGAVEVSDGTEHITVRNVYAENCVYAVDVQDHGKPLQINTNVRLEGVTAVNSTHIVRTANKPHGHAGLTIRDATGIRCAFPLKITNTADVTIENVRISEQPAGTDSALWIINVDGFTLRDVVIRPGEAATPAIRLYDTNDARIENLHRHDGAARPAHGVVVKISKGVTASGFRIHNSVFGPSNGAGILLEKEDDTAHLSGIYVVGNVATVENHFDDEDAEIDDNVDPVPAQTPSAAGLTDDDDDEEPPVSPLAGTRFVPEDVDWAHPVYATSFDDPNELSKWKLEGGKRAAIENGNLILESTPPVEGEESDHLVLWRDQVFPADFLLEFTFRPQSRAEGLAIVFFNARGVHGEGIFDRALKPRHGVFKQYHSSDLNSYHISYWAGARGTANIRKNAGFNLVATGPDLVSPGPADAFQKIRVYKKGGVIRLIVDDIISAAWDDDGTIGGPIHTHDGWIGLRQMEHAVRGEYGEFAVYPLTP